VGGGVSLSARLQRGAAYALRVPAIDIAEVGAGGGSIAWVDVAGALRVGPHSAGAVPGPACYGSGGEEPTLTDANVVLGYLNPTHLLGGTLPIEAERSRQALRTRISEPLGLDLMQAAYGIRRIAISHMSRAVRAVTVERGRSPSDFALIAFGGSGPLHAVEMARDLGIRRVIIPPLPGLFSALGLLCVDVARYAVRTVLLPLQEATASDLKAHFSALETQLWSELHAPGAEPGTYRFERLADVRYKSQSFELTVPAQDLDPVALIAAFEQEHERTYGHAARGDPVELVSVRVVATKPRASADFWGRQPLTGPGKAASATRAAYFGPEEGQHTVPVLRRADLTAQPCPGPFIVEEYDTTIVVPPGSRSWRDEWHNIVVDTGAAL